MARILVCIPSGQAIPNLASIIHYKPEKIIFLQTDLAEKSNFDGKILESLKDRGVTFSSESIHKVSVTDENSILELQTALASTSSFYSTSDELIVNITGGTKPMSIATYNFFSTRIANIVYILNDDKIINCKSDEKTDLDISPPLTCKQHLLAHGFTTRLKQEDNIATNKDVLKIIRLIASDFGNEELIIFENKDQRDRFRDRGSNPGDLNWNPNISDVIKNGVSDIQIKIPETKRFWGKILTGDWLEIVIRDLLVRNKDYLKIHDIQLGPVVSKDNVPNELDVAFMKGTSLNFIECKSGAQAHGSSQDVFHKIESIKKNFGALQVYSHLASSSNNILDKENKIKKEVQQRADLYKCKIIPAEIIRQLAKASTVEQEYEILKPYV
jgi:hypothetical protein